MKIHPGRILFEDDHLLAVMKLAGELVVKGAGKVERLPLLDFLKQQYPGLRPLNRLDFETSGIVLFAKTKAAFEAMKTEYEEAALEKTYRGIVAGIISKKEGSIESPLPARTGKGTVSAKTTYSVLEKFPIATYIEATMQTGRFHQIRRHFAKINHPLLLDDEYGHKKFNQMATRNLKYKRFFLHAYKLSFTHPITHERVEITAPVPDVFEDVLKKLRNI
jgi:RluA family pseudouridine synthase